MHLDAHSVNLEKLKPFGVGGLIGANVAQRRTLRLFQ